MLSKPYERSNESLRLDWWVSHVNVPDLIWRSLIADAALEPVDVVLYSLVWSGRPRGLAELATQAGIYRRTVARSCARLTERGWLTVLRSANSRLAVPLVRREIQEAMIKQLLNELGMAPHKCEFLMRKYLDWRLVSTNYIDNARPGVLTSPITGERLELDRLYLDAAVGFEFNGPQHYGQTKLYHDPKSLKEQQTRDILKKGLSVNSQITLVIVTVDQLHPSVLDTLIPPTLERRAVETEGPYYCALVDLSMSAAAEARSWTR